MKILIMTFIATCRKRERKWIYIIIIIIVPLIIIIIHQARKIILIDN